MSDFFKLDASELTRNLAFKNSEEYVRRYKNKLCNHNILCKNEAKYTVLKMAILFGGHFARNVVNFLIW